MFLAEDIRRTRPSKETSIQSHGYKQIELTGSSTIGIEDAVNTAIASGAHGLHHALVRSQGDVRPYRGDKVAHWQVGLKVGFTLEGA